MKAICIFGAKVCSKNQQKFFDLVEKLKYEGLTNFNLPIFDKQNLIHIFEKPPNDYSLYLGVTLASKTLYQSEHYDLDSFMNEAMQNQRLINLLNEQWKINEDIIYIQNILGIYNEFSLKTYFINDNR